MASIREKLIYSDIITLEIYQALLMLLVNPLNLFRISVISDDCIYVSCCAVLSILLGILSIWSLIKDKLSYRINLAKWHWALCLVSIMLIFKRIQVAPMDIICFYSVQLIVSIYCYWRLNNEKIIRLARG